jgi:hypothetical protein
MIIALMQGTILNSLFFGLLYFTLARSLEGTATFMMSSKENYINSRLTNRMRDIPKLHHITFDLKKFKGKKSFNAGTPIHWPKAKKYRILLGEKLISKFNLNELIFVISHECGHIKKNHIIKAWLLSTILITIIGTLFQVVYLILIKNNLAIVGNGVSFFILAGFMLIFTLLILGGLSWRYESEADKEALKLTNNKKSAQSAFKKLLRSHPQRDYGTILNLLFYDHPLTVDRIKQISSLELEKNSFPLLRRKPLSVSMEMVVLAR